jgi:hypothetical protein
MMKRALAVFACICILTSGLYVAASKWAIRHETLDLFDTARARPVSVDIAVRRDYEMKANAGYWKLPVAMRHGDIWSPAFSRICRPIRH